MNRIIRLIKLGCPNCRGRVELTEVALIGGSVIFNGVCCQKEVTSGPLNALEYVEFPDIKEGKN